MAGIELPLVVAFEAGMGGHEHAVRDDACFFGGRCTSSERLRVTSGRL